MYKIARTTFATDELSIKNNKIQMGNFKLIPNLKREIGKIKDMVYFCRLVLDVKDTPENRFPVDVHIVFVGIFEFKEMSSENEVYSFLKKDAVHSMYPYLRSMLTSLSVTALLPPILLPIVDDTKIFPEETYTIIN